MTKQKLILSLLITLLLLPALNVHAAPPLTEKRAVSTLAKQLEKDRLYADWTKMSCLMFIAEGKTKDHFDIAIREKHGGPCPGDPDTAPIVDRFRVYRRTGRIQWFDLDGELQPYKTLLKERGHKKK